MWPTFFRDHPRSRGEHALVFVADEFREGSSPLARGAHAVDRVLVVNTRIIPARAGSTRSASPVRLRRWDHPRSRGEHTTSAYPTMLMMGSSPLARGAHGGSAGGIGDERIIPARAGSTVVHAALEGGDGDHPRSRGEHAGGGGTDASETGSSPLARGAPHPHQPGTWGGRIIPARAGSTCVNGLMDVHLRDHPRSRGEHGHITRHPLPFLGSSPLARGAHGVRGQTVLQVGIIPARAGSTPCGSSTPRHPGDHPRSRGEHDDYQWSVEQIAGSSPLARGARAVSAVHVGG